VWPNIVFSVRTHMVAARNSHRFAKSTTHHIAAYGKI